MSAADNLTQKLGPLPVWAWAGLAIGGYRGVQWWRDRSTPEPAGLEPAQPEERPATGANSGTQPFVYSLPVAPAPSNSPAVGSSPAGTSSPAPTDNDGWRRLALELLAARGNTPQISAEAIDRYLAGEPLNTQQDALVALAVRWIGAPPQAPPPPKRTGGPIDPPRLPSNPTPGTPAPQPVETPASTTNYTIKTGDTLYSLARARYGNANRSTLDKLAALNGLTWNAAHTSVTPFRVGQQLTLPATL